MRQVNLLRRRLLLAATFSPFLVACSPKAPAMTADEAQRIKALTARMTTRCIGRHLIDLPESFVLNPVWQARIDGVEVNVQPMDQVLFRAAVEGRMRELRRETISGEKENPSLREVRDVPDLAGRAFNRAMTGAVASDRTWEIWAWRDGFVIKLAINAYDKQLAYRVTEGLESDVEEKFAQAIDVLRRVRGRHEDQIPQEPGDCFAHGFIAGPANDQQDISMSFHWRDAHDVYFSFNHTTRVREDDTMLQRSASIERQFAEAGIRTLRKGSRSIHGLAYEEWLTHEPAEVTTADVEGNGFVLRGNEAERDPRKPSIELNLYNGHYIPTPEISLEEDAKIPTLQRASLSDAEAVALWDAVTATLRPRPGAF